MEDREEQRQPQKQKLPDRDGGSGNLVVFPVRQRLPREPRTARSASRSMQWDGEEAALWEETSRVLKGCGVVPENAGRKLREAISLALRQEWRKEEESLAAIAYFAIEMWKHYVSLGDVVRVRYGLMGFFKSGEWLHAGRWRCDPHKLDRWRSRGL